MLPLVIEPETLDQHPDYDDLLIVDLCRDEIYAAQHLPGAVHVSPAELVSGIRPAVGKLPPMAQLSAVLGRIGLSADSRVVAYDDEGGGWAGRFAWTLHVLGYDSVSCLNGGLIAWAGEGRPVTAEVPDVTPTTVDASIKRPDLIAEQAEVLASLDDDQVVIWDARSPEEYAGTRVAAERGGHIPGAINLDWLELMDRHNHLKLRADLEAFVRSRGFDGSRRVITHCQTHHRSGLTYLVGRLLGLDIRAYPGSWSEWGNDPDMPIDNPAA